MPVQIFIPFYGDPALLKLAVRSVLAQSDPNWTLTVVDDGYPDDSIPDYFADIADPRVSYLRNPVNLGANGNYRRCLELADSDLLVLLGADDLLLPNYVATVAATHLAFPESAMIQPGVELIDAFGRRTHTVVDVIKQRWLRPRTDHTPRRALGGEPLAASLLRGNWLYFPSLVFARVPAQQVGFREGLNVVQDLALVLDLIAAGNSMAVDDTVCFRYRRHRASDSSRRALAGSRFVEERMFFRDAADQAATLGWHRAARAARWHLLSRANAMTVLPKAIVARQWAGVSTLLRHVFGLNS